ncbi:MAG: flagellar basal body P-ring formation chaperone FlgA [Rhodospirillaceae bacterium]|nr:flagellar basal body P-ring formation chaperone FlgA [Rhodospirillaceae bacterium]
MTMFSSLVARLAAVTLGTLLFAGTAAANEAHGLDDGLQLNTAITVTGRDIKLGDIFSGYLSRPEKVVAQAPRPGQRLVLNAEWLSALARTYGLNWRAANGYDRAVVYQPGQTISAHEIIAAVKADLIAKGMPANYSVAPNAQLPTVTTAVGAADVGVREAFFDASTKTFSAVVEIPPGAPNAQFVSMRGAAFAVVAVPTLKESAPKNTVITAAMLTTLDLPEEHMRPDTITDAAALIGKAPKIFVRAGVPVRETDVAQMTLVEVPVLNMDMRRDSTIAQSHVTFATFSADALPGDVVTDPRQLIGHTPRRSISAGTPMRRGDIQMVRQVQVPVAARDLTRGEVLDSQDITWVTMDDGDIVSNTITDEADLMGRATKHPIRAGQPLRTYDIARPVAVARGKLVTILWSSAAINLTAQGLAMEAGGVGDVIRVTNTKSKTIVTVEVIDATTVRVASQPQTASR